MIYINVWTISEGVRTPFEEKHPICIKVGDKGVVTRLTVEEAAEICLLLRHEIAAFDNKHVGQEE